MSNEDINANYWTQKDYTMRANFIEYSIFVMFITGILQWDIISIPWFYFSLIQSIHILSSLAVTVLFVIPFINIHTYKYRKNILAKKRNATKWHFRQHKISTCREGSHCEFKKQCKRKER